MLHHDGAIVIAGASAAGLAAADGLREGGYSGEILLLDQETEPGFDRPTLSKSLLRSAEVVPANRLRTPEQLAAKKITVLEYHEAVGLDIDRKLVVTSWGETLEWEHVVIATGLDAVRMRTTAGNQLPALRNRDDLERVRAMVASGRRVTCIGAGLIGLEVAAALRGHGIDVTLISNHQVPLGAVLGEEIAAWVIDRHRAHGVVFELGSAVTHVNEVADGYLIHTADGEEFGADNLLAAVGATPNTQWLLGSGVHLSGGVVVDEAGRTNVPNIWAAGDVAVATDPQSGRPGRYEHWTHAVDQGRHIGLNIARGVADPFTSVPYFWHEVYDTTLHTLGQRGPDDRITVAEGSLRSGEFVALHGSGDSLHAVTICGSATSIRRYKRLLRDGASVQDALAAAANYERDHT